MNRFQEKYRHELKYMVDEREAELAVFGIKGIMKADQHYPKGKYRIRSVYFDDIYDSALMENLNGTSPRSKYRIRIYNENKEVICLEKKIKNHDLTRKKSCPLSKAECDRLLGGEIGRITSGEERELLTDLRLKMLQNCFGPKIIVEYERTAFTCKDGNVRVTFDRKLTSSGFIDKFWEKQLPKRPVMANGKCIMEVKYDEFLPDSIRNMLNTGKMERITFSKYALCRIYGMNGKEVIPAAGRHKR